MKWRGRRRSTNVRDARGQRVSGGNAGVTSIINVVLRMFGIKGVLVLGALAVVGWGVGLIDPVAMLRGGQVQTVDYAPSPGEQERFDFVTVVLADTEDIWNREFARVGRSYQEPELVVYTDRHPTACGMGDAVRVTRACVS